MYKMKTSNISLDSWQEKILKLEGNVLLCTGRQVGKTTIFAIKIAEYMATHKDAQVIVVSLTEDQAKLIIVMILDYLEKHYKAYIRKGTHKPTQNKIQLNNGSVVLARPVGTTGDAVRGFTGDILYIDEASRMPQLVWDAAKPTLLTTDGHIWMSSTPFGKQGYFYESFLNKNERYTVFHINSEDVVTNRPICETWTQTKRDGAIRLLKEEKADMSELQYGQEYLGLFLEELRQYFPDKLIDNCCVLKRPKLRPKDNLFMGVDIARLGEDKITYEILYKNLDGETNQVDNIVREKQLTTQTERDILYLNEVWNLSKIGLDAGSGSLGVGILDHLLETNIKKKVKAMNNRKIVIDRDGNQTQRIFKEDMYDNMVRMMENGNLKLLDDESIRNSLRSIQWEIKGTKVRIFGVDNHITEGLVRAAWLAKKAKLNKGAITYI